jgi:hypothetical protein
MSTLRSGDQRALERTPPPCDRHPSAHALVLVESPNWEPPAPRGQLAFCGHCYEGSALLLAAVGWVVVADTRPRLIAQEMGRRR